MALDAFSKVLGTQVDRVMELARRHLEMDVVLLSEFCGDQQVFRVLEGDAATFGFSLGQGRDLHTSYCKRLVDGAIPNAIPDTSTEVRVRDLPDTEQGKVGSYIGVPLRLADGTLYGTFCCMSHEAKGLNNRDVHFMSMLGDLVVDELEAQRKKDALRAGIAGLLSGEQMRVALQPIVSLHSGVCLGVEALARFPVPFGPPDSVFATAQQVGLGFELERMAFRHALELLPQIPQEQFLAINLSPAVALDLSLEAGPDSDHFLRRLVVEITEHAVVAGYAELRERLAPYRARGLRLAIDDAGAGYASLHHIVELEPDIIKIDRSLINGVAVDRGRRSVVAALVLLALDLRATVVAEGIETSEDFFAACDLGVDAAQGFLLARPSTSRRALARWSSDTITIPDRALEAGPALPRIGGRGERVAVGSNSAMLIPSDRVTVNF